MSETADALALEPAAAHEIEPILGLARAFHAEDGHPLSKAGEAALRGLAGTSYGEVLAIHEAGRLIGYAVLCYGYSVEYGGRDAFIDDLYIVPAARGRGLGGAILTRLVERVRAGGFGAIHLEVMDENPAIELYRRAGFEGRGSRFLSRRFREARE
jgi:ribosomal protein S18 acetylase RimI-like enzyme